MKNTYTCPELVDFGTIQEMTGYTGGAAVDDTFTNIAGGVVTENNIGHGSVNHCDWDKNPGLCGSDPVVT